MANYIPKLQYKNFTTGCTTESGSPNLSGIADAGDLYAGMEVTGTGIPTGTTLLSVDASTSTAVMSANATATGSGVSLDFYFEIVFPYPPEGPETEAKSATRTVSKSLSGVQQTVMNYIEVTRTPTFKQLPQATMDLLDTFYEEHAAAGGEFRYFESSDETSYETYTLNQDDLTPERTSWTGTQYLYTVPLAFRRVA